MPLSRITRALVLSVRVRFSLATKRLVRVVFSTVVAGLPRWKSLVLAAPDCTASKETPAVTTRTPASAAANDPCRR